MLRSTYGSRLLFPAVLRGLLSLLVMLGFVLTPSGPALAANSCALNSFHNNIRHVIYIQFDNKVGS